MADAHETRVVEYGDGPDRVRIVVARANVRRGMIRTRLKAEAQQAGETDPDLLILRWITYPDLTASAIEVDGLEWPMSFDQFLDLPEPLCIDWEAAAYDLNPHWIPTPPDEADVKNAPAPSTAA